MVLAHIIKHINVTFGSTCCSCRRGYGGGRDVLQDSTEVASVSLDAVTLEGIISGHPAQPIESTGAGTARVNFVRTGRTSVALGTCTFVVTRDLRG